jgi:chromosomal replication initiation ATPase DnaA
MSTTTELNTVLRDLRSLVVRAEALLDRAGGLRDTSLAGVTPEQTKKVQVVVEVVSQRLGVPVRDIFSRDRHELIARARQLCMMLACRELRLSSTQVGIVFRRDHADVLWACKRVEGRLNSKCDFGRQLAGITAEVRTRLSTN